MRSVPSINSSHLKIKQTKKCSLVKSNQIEINNRNRNKYIYYTRILYKDDAC